MSCTSAVVVKAKGNHLFEVGTEIRFERMSGSSWYVFSGEVDGERIEQRLNGDDFEMLIDRVV